MTWTEISVAIVAIYGAFLSTYNLILNLKEKNKKLIVSVSMGFLEYEDYLGKQQLILTARNPTNKKINLNPPYILLPDGSQIIFRDLGSDVIFPHELLSGKSCFAWTDFRKFLRTIKENNYSGTIKIRCVYSDQIDNYHMSKPFNLNIDFWTKDKKWMEGE